MTNKYHIQLFSGYSVLSKSTIAPPAPARLHSTCHFRAWRLQETRWNCLVFERWTCFGLHCTSARRRATARSESTRRLAWTRHTLVASMTGARRDLGALYNRGWGLERVGAVAPHAYYSNVRYNLKTAVMSSCITGSQETRKRMSDATFVVTVTRTSPRRSLASTTATSLLPMAVKT